MINTFTSNITTVATVGVCTNASGYGYYKAQVTMQRGDNINGIVTINGCFFIAEADFSTGAYFNLGTIDEAFCRPNGYITIPGSEIVLASNYEDGDSGTFAGTQVLDTVSYLISPNGNIDVYVAAVTTPCTLASVDHILFPINISFTNLIEEDITIPL